MLLVHMIAAVLAQSAPPPPIAIEDWSARHPIANSHRVSVVCPDGGKVTAEFERKDLVVSVVEIDGFSRPLSRGDRAAINSAVAPLHVLDRIEIDCNGPNEAIIHILGGFKEVEGKMMRQLVPLVWGRTGLRGTGRSEFPQMELSPNLR